MNLDKYTFPKIETSVQGVPASALDEARGTLHEARCLASKIIGLSDRLLGAMPTAEGNVGAPAPAAGELDRFRAEMRDTRQAMIFADDALTRIEQELIG